MRPDAMAFFISKLRLKVLKIRQSTLPSFDGFSSSARRVSPATMLSLFRFGIGGGTRLVRAHWLVQLQIRWVLLRA